MDLNGANRESFLSLLFYAVSAEKGWPKEDRRLSTLYERMPQAKHAWDHIESLLQGLGIEELSSVESAVSRLANVFEQQGFTNGFRLGMMLREELIR